MPSLLTWGRRRFTPARTRPRRAGNLAVELLEDRCLPSATVSVDLSAAQQTIYGFGAGMKRQTTQLRNMQEPFRTEVLNLIFADVNTRILRTYLRHEHELVNDNDDPNVLDLGALDFSAYADDFWVLQQAKAIVGSRIDTFYASLNTGPAWMKTNDDIIGGTLFADAYDEFGELIWGYLRYVKEVEGIDIAALSMFNEPNFLADHDSMNPSPAQAADIFAAVGAYLTTQTVGNPNVRLPLLLGPDGSGTPASLNYLNALLNHPAAGQYLNVVASHYYGGTRPDWATLNDRAGPDRQVWQTEWGTLTNSSDGIGNGLLVATRIHDVFSTGNEAYVHFQWVQQTAPTGEVNAHGLIRIQNNGYVVPKRYYTFKQWANTTPAGSVRIGAAASDSGLLTTAYLWPDGRTASIQVINNTPTTFPDATFQLTAPGSAVQRYRTTAALNFEPDLAFTPAGNTFTDTIDAFSFATYVVTLDQPPGVAGVVIDDGTAQRSAVRSITVAFDRAVTLDPGGFELLRQGVGPVGLNVSTFDLEGRTLAVLTFTGPGVIGGSLADGDYTLTIRGDLIHDDLGQRLDGDGDGAAGGDRLEAFFRLYGDTDGDHDVGLADALRFLSTFGRRAGDPHYLSYVDYNADGGIGVVDLLAFADRLLGSR